jgi:Tn3 transposase DDE domain
LVTNAWVLWTTTYLCDTIDALRAEGFEISGELAGHLTPAQHDHINFYAPTPSTSTPSNAAKVTDHYASPHSPQ